MNQNTVKPKRALPLFWWLGLVSLVLAYGTGQYLKGETITELIQGHFPAVAFSAVDWSDDSYGLTSIPENTPIGYLVTKATAGWGGPLLVAVQFSSEGEIKNVVVLTHKETPAFFRSLQREGFFKQFAGKKTQDTFEVGSEIQAVSGATVSSAAFTTAVRLSAHDLGTNLLNLKIEVPREPWEIGADEAILLLLYAVIIISILRKIIKIRKMILVFCIGFLGVHLASPISISNIGALLLGYFPPVKTQLFWYLLVVGTLLLILIWGRNLYCVWMCPFGAIQEMITTIAGLRIRVPGSIIRYAEYLILFLLWASLIIMFLTTTPALGMFEPFATLFSLKGSGVQWYLVSASILASFVVPRFWCRFFCPVGAFFRNVISVRKTIIRSFTQGKDEKKEP